MNTIHLIEKYDLNDLEKQLVEYMDANIHQLKSISIRQMAKDNFTSTSSIYKLCNKFGFQGYSDMIFHLSSTHDQKDIHNTKYLDYKQTFSTLINQHKRIIIYGLGFSSSVAEYMHQRLTLKGYHSLCVVHLDMFHKVIDSDTVFIVISHSGKTQNLIDFIDLANQKNIPVISFVANRNSPIYKQATLPIEIGDYDTFSYELDKKNTFFGESIIAFEHLLFD